MSLISANREDDQRQKDPQNKLGCKRRTIWDWQSRMRVTQFFASGQWVWNSQQDQKGTCIWGWEIEVGCVSVQDFIVSGERRGCVEKDSNQDKLHRVGTRWRRELGRSESFDVQNPCRNQSKSPKKQGKWWEKDWSSHYSHWRVSLSNTPRSKRRGHLMMNDKASVPQQSNK